MFICVGVLAIIILDNIVLAQLSITLSSLEEIMLLRISSESFKTRPLIVPFAITSPAVMAGPPTDTRLLLSLYLSIIVKIDIIQLVCLCRDFFLFCDLFTVGSN